MPTPRSRPQRRRDTEHRLTHDIDVWVASASADGAPYLVPLSFDWDGEALLVATPTGSPTGRNLATTRTVRLGLGHTRDVSMIEGEVEILEIDALPQQRRDRFAARTGFDPRALAPSRWHPRRSPRPASPRCPARASRPPASSCPAVYHPARARCAGRRPRNRRSRTRRSAAGCRAGRRTPPWPWPGRTRDAARS